MTILSVTWNAFEIICILFKEITLYFLKTFFTWRDKSMQNEIVLVTGGGKGIGKKIAVALASHGPKQVILWGRSKESLEETAEAVRTLGVQCTTMQCDVCSKEQIQQKANEIQNTVGHVTMLVNNAGVVSGLDICESGCDDILATIKTNTMANIWTIRCFLPTMLEANHGHIVSINSVLGLMGLPGAADYCASKHAVNGFMEALALELDEDKKHNVHLTSVHPFVINTDMFQGCHTRFPWLFPALDQDYVAERTVKAILTNQKVLIMPYVMNLVLIAKAILPVDAMITIQRFFGVDSCMKNHHSRRR